MIARHHYAFADEIGASNKLTLAPPRRRFVVSRLRRRDRRSRRENRSQTASRCRPACMHGASAWTSSLI